MGRRYRPRRTLADWPAPIHLAPTPTPRPLKGALRQGMGRAVLRYREKHYVPLVLGVALAAHAFAPTHPDASAGRSIFESQCTRCHGPTGGRERGPALNRPKLDRAPVAPSDSNTIYVGSGEACLRGKIFLRRRRPQIHRCRKDLEEYRAARFAGYGPGNRAPREANTVFISASHPRGRLRTSGRNHGASIPESPADSPPAGQRRQRHA